MSHKLCYQQHPEESAGGARAELMLCCVVLCCVCCCQDLFPGNRACDIFVPIWCGRKWRGLFRVPREHTLGQMPLVGLTCSGSGNSCLPS